MVTKTPSERRQTATSTFGVSKRESHDATDFYERFEAPDISDDDEVCVQRDLRCLDTIIHGDISEQPGILAPKSVALVVTSPPYFAGKAYETDIGKGVVPASYLDYLNMLRRVFSACVEVLEPGGRIAVNVANLGRKPYRSLSADVIRILQDDLGLLLRGEILWQKAKGASGNCAWGSFQSPADPVLHDVTERVIVASKGRFDRAHSAAQRDKLELPSQKSISRDEFMASTLDIWQLQPESATRVGHPAPFPVELPQRLIELFTYRGDVILDPFMGSGSSAIAALRSNRHFVGFDTDKAYVKLAQERIEKELARVPAATNERATSKSLPDHGDSVSPHVDSAYSRAIRGGRRAKELAEWLLLEAGFTVKAKKKPVGGGLVVDLVAEDGSGNEYFIDVIGGFGLHSNGLLGSDEVMKAVGKAAFLRHQHPHIQSILMSPTVLPPGHRLAKLLDQLMDGSTPPFHLIIDLSDPNSVTRLRQVLVNENLNTSS